MTQFQKDLLKEQLELLQVNLAKFKGEIPETETFADAPVETKERELKITDVAIGGKVDTIQADGSLAPAPDGEYKTGADMFTVKDGLIVEINGDKGEQPKKEEMSAEPVQDNTDVESIKTELAEQKALLEAYKAETEALKVLVEDFKSQLSQSTEKEQTLVTEFTAQVNELKEAITVLASIPVQFSKTNQSNTVKDSNAQKTESFKSFFGLQ